MNWEDIKDDDEDAALYLSVTSGSDGVDRIRTEYRFERSVESSRDS